MLIMIHLESNEHEEQDMKAACMVAVLNKSLH